MQRSIVPLYTDSKVVSNQEALKIIHQYVSGKDTQAAKHLPSGAIPIERPALQPESVAQLHGIAAALSDITSA